MSARYGGGMKQTPVFSGATVNRKLCEILGYSREELLRCRFDEITHPDDLNSDLPQATRMLAGEISTYSIEMRNLRKDRSVIWIHLTVSLVRHPSGEPAYFITFIEDITERKRLEAQLHQEIAEHRRLKEALAQELEERRRVEAVIRLLNDRLMCKYQKSAQTCLANRLTSGCGEGTSSCLKRGMLETHHRVKNNLQVVTAMIDVQVMEHSHEGIVPLEELRRLGMHIRSLAIVHDLLTQNLRDEESDQRISIKGMLARLIPLLEQIAQGCSIRFELAELSVTSKQCAAIALLLNELISNAVKHGSGPLETTLAVEDGIACLQVCDRGPGFPDNFDPIAAANTGLQLVESIGRTDLAGAVTYENRIDGGAKVNVTFPLPVCEKS
jgi:PAS domain S-box-containing protein